MCSPVSMCVIYCRQGNLVTIIAAFTYACAHISKIKLLLVRRHVTVICILLHGAEVDVDFLPL